ncbi:MAG: SdrD B-like domain-containing protein [Actinomycetota bacterium]|nr:SdrD B-like domain-containing protein [Actinomycetota bacterium]
MRRQLGIAAIGVAGLATIISVVSGSSPSPDGGVDAQTVPSTSAPASTTITIAPATTAPATTVAAPPREARYVVSEGEVEREAKQLAADIAYALTTYEQSDDPTARFSSIAGAAGVDLLAEAGEPLTHRGRWSRGQVVYPQLGGLTNERTSVMVVTRQTVGSGSEPEFSVVRTLDIRLIMGEAGWEFDALASAGGAFGSVEDLELAHAVAADPRIEMPDSARLDILGGEVSPVLLELMSDLADITPYGVTVMATGHPYHVFETNRVSHHTGGRAIDIFRVGDRHVIDDRDGGSATRVLVQRLWEDPRVVQVGSPWDIDGGPGRSFANVVHQDHIHVAVIGRNDPTWVPAIGDRVWEDVDADGIQDQGEPGIGGVTVHLFDDAGREIGSTLTNDDGRYEFRNLWYGEYHVEVDIPAGFLASPRNQGSDDSKDSDIDSGGVMAQTTLDPREHDPRWDAGLYRRASIGDRVWEDLDADGVQDAGEGGVGGVTVRLFDGAATEVGSTVTSDDGSYVFSNLTPGAYQVEIDILGGFVASPRDQGSDDAKDSDIDSGGVMAQTTLDSNENDLRWDAGLTRPASIGDLVWEDLDGDGIQDPGEPGIAGVTVRLFNSGGTQVRSTVTDADGEYLFSNLMPGVYHIEIDIPEGFVATLRDQGPDDATDSDVDEDGVMAPTTLDPGESDKRWDAGLLPGP